MTDTQHTRILGALPASRWHRPNLRYFAPVDGGEGATPTDPPAGQQPPAGDQPPAGTPAPSDPAGDDTPPWSAEEYDREKAWKKIQAQKADLDAERSKRAQAIKEAETAAEKRAAEKAYKDIGKTLGVITEDETPTVEGLSQALQDKDQTLTTAQAENQALRIENAILRHADRFGGDVDALTDSESFKKKLKELDSTADDHAAQVEALVKTTVESNARYRKVQVAPKSSDGDPAPTGGAPTGEKTVDDIRKERQNRRGLKS
jgi:hypothetical protein